jgi:hypothetical protein
MLSMAQSETDSCWQECTATLILYCYPIGVRISNILLQTQLVLGQFGRGASPTLRLISDEDKPPEGFLTRNSSVTQNVTRTKVKEPFGPSSSAIQLVSARATRATPACRWCNTSGQRLTYHQSRRRRNASCSNTKVLA